jgi:hypothetical protein
MSTFNQGVSSVPVILNSSNVLVFGNTSSGNALSVQQLGAGNVVAFSNANGTVGLFVSATSNVGVGTTNPIYNLDIQTAFGAQNPTSNLFRIYSAAYPTGTSNTALRIEKGTGYGGVISGYITQGVAAGLRLSTLGGAAPVDVMTLTGSNVGIGTTNPVATFHVGAATGFYGGTSGGAAVITSATAVTPLIAGQASTVSAGNMYVGSSATYARNTGGGIIMGGRGYDFGGGSNFMPFARISGVQRADADTYDGDFVVETMGNGSGNGTLYERMRITAGGRVGIGTASPGFPLHLNATDGAFSTYNGADQKFSIYHTSVGTGGWSSAGSCMYIARQFSTNRSINASGTLNASGADYAEYMTKTSDFTINKGDVVGVNSQGLLTNVFTESVTFVVKTTDPSYVGGDSWGTEEALGMTKPKEVKEEEPGYAEYQTALAQFNAKLEEARARVDRIAFAGQVPVNVLGSTPGQYIVPVASENGSISGQAVSNPTMEQYMAAVGKVIKVLPDGRAQIIVKVV